MIKKLFFILFLCIVSLGFSQEKSIQTLTAFPNPFKNSTQITFQSDGKSSVIFSVKNILGKTVHQEKIKTTKGKNTLPFSRGDLAAGIYIYTIRNTKNNISKRFVIQ